MSGNYPDGFNQRMHDDYFDRPAPDTEDKECPECGEDVDMGLCTSCDWSVSLSVNRPDEPPAESEPHRE